MNDIKEIKKSLKNELIPNDIENNGYIIKNILNVTALNIIV